MYLIKPSYEILTEINPQTILKILELAGRVCWKSEDKITDDSAIKFCKMILNKNHESVIEHMSLSVRFIVCRGFTHELVRHRLASFSQESTRYCNYNKKGMTFIIPPWLTIIPGEYTLVHHKNLFGAITGLPTILSNNIVNKKSRTFIKSLCRCEEDYNQLLKEGWKPQEAREVLDNALKTEIVMTANLREWRHVLKLRTQSAAHPQMQEIMRPLLDELKEKIPVIFDEINYR